MRRNAACAAAGTDLACSHQSPGSAPSAQGAIKMESRAKLLGHPIHQMLIPFPFGLLATAVIFDVVYLISGSPAIATSAYWIIAAGIIGGVVAAPFGLIDWLAIPKATRARTIGMVHGLG